MSFGNLISVCNYFLYFQEKEICKSNSEEILVEESWLEILEEKLLSGL